MVGPNTFVVGAPKCGTTAVTRLLEAHPEVFVADRKDIHFFGSDLDFRGKARESEADYRARFAAGASRPVRVDSSVWMLASTRAAAEIAAFDAGARVIVLLRHPVEAMQALHDQLRLNGLGDEDEPDFARALALEPARAGGAQLPPHTPLPMALQYRANVRFATQLARYDAVFPRDQILVLLQEDLKARPAETTRALFAFLGVDPSIQPEARAVNTRKEVRSEGLRRLVAALPPGWKAALPRDWRVGLRRALRRWNSRHAPRPPLDPALRARLVAELAPEVEALEARLGRDLSAWKR